MKEYEVVGDRETLGFAPGERFSMDLPEAQEERLIKRGSISVVGEDGSDESQPEEAPAPPEETFSPEVEGADDDEEVNGG